MKRHPITGENICRPLKSLRLVLPIIRSHHEHFDGSGYPDGLAGEQIPILARAITVADCFDAMRTRRIYKDAVDFAKTAGRMLEIAGKRYANLDEVSDGDVRQALMTSLHDLEAFAGGMLSLAAVDRPAVTPAAAATRQAAAARAADQAPAEYKPLPAPSMNPFKQMAVLREIAKNPPPVLKGITEQIDDVLQGQIIGTPMIHRGLHVKPGPRGDAIFEADGQSYASVDELPDVEVRDVLRAAIMEWVPAIPINRPKSRTPSSH